MNTRNEILYSFKTFFEQHKNSEEGKMLDHLSNDLTRLSYILKAEEVVGQLQKGARVLDWGSGFGQMSFAMAKLGLNPTIYDVVKRKHNLNNELGLDLVFGTDEVKLPFEDNQFDAVISCGVLEHVPNILGSLHEIYRILRPGGKFFIYNLPYILSPSEFYASYRKISVHPIRFTKSGTTQLLELAGFRVEAIGHENGIPKRLSGPLQKIRVLAKYLTRFFLFVDWFIVRTPIVKGLISNSIKAVAVKPEVDSPERPLLNTLWWD